MTAIRLNRVWPVLWTLVVAFWVGAFWSGTALAQQGAALDSYVQVEAQPTLAGAQDRARVYAGSFPDVQGFRLNSGWYAILLGPMTAQDAADQLSSLRVQGLIPSDSYLTTADQLGQRFWPVGDSSPPGATAGGATSAGSGATVTLTAGGTSATRSAGQATADTSGQATPAAAAPPEETRAQALAAERALTVDQLKELQQALQWYGFYKGAIDAAFGPGTRASMSAYQTSKGYDATGVLTTNQRAELVNAYRADLARIDFQPVSDSQAGIEVSLPMGLVRFDSYTPPFVQYLPKNDSGLTIRLISEPGDVNTLAALYQVLRKLDIMPEGGLHRLSGGSFTLSGESDTVSSFASASVGRDGIKGYLVTWTPAMKDTIGRVLPEIGRSFRSNGAKVLDPGLVPLSEAVQRGLLAGLHVKAPASSRSGIFVTAEGAAVTSGAGLDQCRKLTLERDTPAKIVARDPDSGLVLLTPDTPIAPMAYATLADRLPQKGAQVSAVGWSYGGRLPQPVVNPGILDDTQGLDGSTDKIRLALNILPGDVGGPVMDASGSVIGLVLPAMANGAALPEGVAQAATVPAILKLLDDAQLQPSLAGPGAAPVSPDALNRQAVGMTTLVGCWK